ncbi:probable LRR receptor-like serine/threonine-protein kinase At1g74360 [Amaranthus tricolor]|uniref:probable LRR receptor-like serine/threonine-protein kinase At1g74360 n=1 Tax=Amaranthus tricolor TaxID=29722 RepID=UPI00258AEC8B|nr:probable LRR receptor-like serine/threonine-protein kinase At1g74360 [Amaranthus tricolor]
MVEEDSDRLALQIYKIPLSFILLIIFSGAIIKADALTQEQGREREILMNLKSFLEVKNKVNRGNYTKWNQFTSDHCDWSGVSCDPVSGQVTGIDLSSSSLNGEISGNFSGLSELKFLDLSGNTLSMIPDDLGGCKNLKILNVSHNMISGELNFTGFSSLEVLDLSMNKIGGEIQVSFPAICSKLRVLNISTNNFTGSIDGCFDGCPNLEYIDLSANNFTGKIWSGFSKLKGFDIGENQFSGSFPSWYFNQNCSLEILDLSENNFNGEFPDEISNCKNLSDLILGGNNFTGSVPETLGSISGLKVLILGGNKFSNRIPESLLNCKNLLFLDLSSNDLGNEIPPILGRFTQLQVLVLHNNSFNGGLNSSGIFQSSNLRRLDLSFNKFSGHLPAEISSMVNLQFLDFAYNNFSGEIPSEYGNLNQLLALDLSHNRLTGSIPPSLGKLTSLLWLMLANNSLTGEIPSNLGNCSSLLWLNLANNNLYGRLPVELTKIGSNPMPTFLSNRHGKIVPGSGECLAMKRWIPADYPPFSFVYSLLTRKSCRSIWDRILKGYGLFPICSPGSKVQTLQISGYLQLTGNLFSGEIPSEIGNMKNFSMLHFADNHFNGSLPSTIDKMSLAFLNVSRNRFSGTIPMQIGNLWCLQDLDLSMNNFSGVFPTSLNMLGELSKFNVSFNPFISGVIPSTGQLSTFDKECYLGNPLLVLPPFINGSSKSHLNKEESHKTVRGTKLASFLVVIILVLVFLISGVLSILCYNFAKTSSGNTTICLLKDTKWRHDLSSCSSNSSSSPWISDAIKIIRLDKTAFTHSDILKATGNFSEDRVIGRGGYATVYKGVFPDGRVVAVKKLQSSGIEGEREFQAEMDVLSQNGVNWPHPNLVNLYGWCLDGADKLLVYEYMEGGTLEDLISDRTRLRWKTRVEIAIDIARALVFLHHECYPSIVHRDVKASNVLLDRNGKARVTDFGLARVVDAGHTHVTTTVAGTVGYVAPEYSQTWQATTKGDVYSFGVLAMELATGRRAVDGGEECLLEWARRVVGENEQQELDQSVLQELVREQGKNEGASEMGRMLCIGMKCTAETPQARPNMKEVLSMLIKIIGYEEICKDYVSIVCDV